AEIPLEVQLTGGGPLPGQRDVTLRPAGRLLRPDTSYRLSLRGSALQAAWPVPHLAPVERDLRFSTVASPRPQPVAEPIRLGWGAPLQLQWNIPLVELRHEVSPSVSSHAWIDPNEGRVSYVQIDDAEAGASYKVTVTDALSEQGIHLQQSAIY